MTRAQWTRVCPQPLDGFVIEQYKCDHEGFGLSLIDVARETPLPSPTIYGQLITEQIISFPQSKFERISV